MGVLSDVRCPQCGAALPDPATSKWRVECLICGATHQFPLPPLIVAPPEEPEKPGGMFRITEVAGQVEIEWKLSAAPGFAGSLIPVAVLAVPLGCYLGFWLDSLAAGIAPFVALVALLRIHGLDRTTVTVDHDHLRVARRPIGINRKFGRGDIAQVRVEQVTHREADADDAWEIRISWAVNLVTNDARVVTIADVHRESEARFLASRLMRALGQSPAPAQP